MKEQEAHARGYGFTGIYDDNRNRVKIKSDEIRKQGYETSIVSNYASGYERGAGVKKGMVLGYSVYADKNYFRDREKKNIRIQLSRIPNNRILETQLYEKKLWELDKNEAELLTRLKELESMNPLTKANIRELKNIRSKLTRIRAVRNLSRFISPNQLERTRIRNPKTTHKPEVRLISLVAIGGLIWLLTRK